MLGSKFSLDWHFSQTLFVFFLYCQHMLRQSARAQLLILMLVQKKLRVSETRTLSYLIATDKAKKIARP